MHLRLLTISLLTLAPAVASAQTVVPPGNLVGSQTWTSANSPYVLAGDLTVPAGTTLTIQAGTTVQLGTGDSLASGIDSNRTELTVTGTLVVNGTAMSPVSFVSGAGAPSTSDYYGVVLQGGATVNMTYATISHAHRGIHDSSTGATLSNLTISNCNYGFYNTGGSPTLTGSTIQNGTSYGIYGTSGSITATNVTVRNNNSYGVYAANTALNLSQSFIAENGSYGVYVINSTGSRTSSLTHNTVWDNNSYGIYFYEQSGTQTITIRDNMVLDNGTYGIRRSGTPISTVSHNLVFGSPTAYSGTSGGTGAVTENPLVVNQAMGDLRPTSRSGARNAASDGMDIGAFAYDGVATPGLVGHIYVNTTLTAAASPHVVTGDLTVEPGITLTIEPGATVRFAETSDLMGAGEDTGRSELRVGGTLVADGTTSLGITIESNATTPSRGDWYGIYFLPGASASIVDYATIRHGRYGVRSQAPAGTTVQRTLIEESSSYGVYVTAGSFALSEVHVRNNQSYGIYYANASGSVTGSRIVDNGSYGAYFISSTGSHTVDVIGNTVAENNSYGIYFYEQSGTLNITVRDNLVLSNGTYGIRRSGTPISSVSYNLVWGQPTNYSGTSGGTGAITENPLVVDQTNRDLRITSNSPARNHASDGGDIGALTFDGAPTVGVQGHLYTNTTWTSAGGPVVVLGDITVEPGITLTIQAGTVVRFAAGGDSMAGNTDTNRTELRVLGRLVSAGSVASPVVLRSDATTPSRGDWYGVHLTNTAANSSVDHTEITHARYGVYSQAPSTASLTQSEIHESSSYGVYITGGGLQVDGARIHDNQSYGLYIANASSDVTNTIVDNNGSYGVYAISSSGSHTVNLNHLTVYSNNSYGVYIYEQSGVLTATLDNSIVASNGTYGVRRSGTPIFSPGRNDVWGQPTDYSGTSAGAGSISANPQFVNTMLANYYLLPSSTCIDAGNPATAASSDFEGTMRPLDGTGNMMALPDLGALEYNPSANRWPIADAGVDRIVTTGLPATFSGLGSVDPDGTIASYIWDFGDGTMGSGAMVTHTYSGGTDRVVTLTVTDNAGAIDVDTINVEVNLPPVANAGPTRFADPAEIVMFNGNGSTDADGSIVTYLWNFGDGASASGQSVTHQYTTGGAYTVTLTVTDDDGATGVGTTTANITGNDGAPPTIGHMPITAVQQAGTPVVVSADVTDASGVASVVLYYRTAGQPVFNAAPMANTSGATYQATIPGTGVQAPGVDYYIQATDSAASSNSGTNPPGGPTSFHSFTVTAPQGPQIVHTPVGNGQAAGTAVSVMATVTAGTTLASVTLYYRTQGGGAFTSVTMNTAGNDLYTADIPGAGVAAPAVEYYIEAVDTANPANTATHPAGMGAVHAFTVTQTDTSPPTIVHTPVADGQMENAAVTVVATVTDATGVGAVSLFYRVSGGGGFAMASMTNTSGDDYEADIPAGSVTQIGVDYYVSAADTAAPPNAGTDPMGAPTTFHSFTVMRAINVAAGDLVITEVMNDPTGSETDREWFELFNTTAGPIDIDGFTFSDLGTDSFTVNNGGPLVVPSGGYLVLGRNADTGANGGVTVGYEYSGMALSNNDDEIIVSVGGMEIDRVAYDAGATFPNTSGAAMSLDPDQIDYSLNDDGGSWCSATSMLASGDLGTPGAANDPCTPIDDVDPPVVNHTPVRDGQAADTPVPVVAIVSDPSGVATVEVHYRARGGGAYDVLALTSIQQDTYSGEIPATAVTLAGVEYYIRAVDASGASNEVLLPTNGDTNPLSFDVTATDMAGPSITHTPIADDQPGGLPVEIFARVLDPSTVASATLHYQAIGMAWTTAAMTDTGGGLFMAEVPAGSVTTAGVNYYIEAEDGALNTSSLPEAGMGGPYTFTVQDVDVEGPKIVHTVIADDQPSGTAVAISATVTDVSSVAEVLVYFRPAGTAAFLSAAMTSAGGDEYTGEIPAALTTGTGVDYYLEATDASDDQNLSRDPPTAPMDVHSFTIAGGNTGDDTEPPAVLHIPVTDGQKSGVGVEILAEIVDPSGITSAEVLYRAGGSNAFVSLALENEAGTNRYRASIPAGAVVTGRIEYYLRATDASAAANQALRPEAAPNEVFGFTVDGATDGTDPADEGGCGCTSTEDQSSSTATLPWLLALVLLVRRRR